MTAVREGLSSARLCLIVADLLAELQIQG